MLIKYEKLDDGDWACILTEIETIGTGETKMQAAQEAKELMISLAEAIMENVE